VVWIYARWVVAFVANKKVFFNFAMFPFINNTMCSILSTFYGENAVSILMFCACPFPAAGFMFLYKGPKSLFMVAALINT